MIRSAYHYATVVRERIFGKSEPSEIKFIYIVYTATLIPIAFIYAYYFSALDAKPVV